MRCLRSHFAAVIAAVTAFGFGTAGALPAAATDAASADRAPARATFSHVARSEARPALVLLLVIDQARADYLAKLRPHLQGGLARLLDHSVRFEDAHHAHALTNTGPGHAAISTGRHPRASGIVGNGWYDRSSGRKVYCVEDPSAPLLPVSAGSALPDPGGRSPANLLVPALPDWIKGADSRSRVFSISAKDRAAVLLGGKRPDAAYWYSFASGDLVTSGYYLPTVPAWVSTFNAERGPRNQFGRAWEALPTTPAMREAFGVREPVHARKVDGFPHLLGGLSFTPTPRFFEEFASSGLFDAHLVEFAKRLVRNESVGRDASVDYLAIGFSSLDLVGHRYGPHSAEVLDTLLRLDFVLADLLDFLDREIGGDRILIALTSDHGVAPLPEVVASDRPDARRLGTRDGLCLQGLERHLSDELGPGRWLLWDLYLDYQTIGRNDVRRRRVEAVAREHLEACEAVKRVWTRSELGREDHNEGAGERHAAYYRHSFNAERSPDLLIEYHPYRLALTGRGTTHGSPHRYDTHVPLLFAGPGITPHAESDYVRTVDIAPTLAALAGVPAPSGLDGTSLAGRVKAGRRSGTP